MENIIDLIPTQSTHRKINKRSILIYQGEVPRQVYIVVSGLFKVYRLGSFGEEQIAGFRTKGDIFPVSWLFGKTSSTLFYYEAIVDSEVITVEKPVLLELSEKYPAIKQQLFDYIMTGYTGLTMQVTALEQSRAAEKVLLMMYYLMFRYGKEVSGGAYRVDLQLTHTILGNLMGLTRETTTVELGRLKRKKIINYDSKSYTIYRKELERHLGDESFGGIRLQES